MAMSGFDSVVQDLVLTAVLEEYDQVARHADSRSSARSNSREQRWRVVTALVFAPDREVRFASDSPVEESGLEPLVPLQSQHDPRHRPHVADRQHPNCITNPPCQF
jgi:hypothetical protein